MKFKAVSGIMLMLLLTSFSVLAFNIRLVRASGIIYTGVDAQQQSGIHKTVDVFRGSFSPSNRISLEVDETAEISFNIEPIMDIRDTNILILLPGDLVELAEGGLEWRGDVGKDESVGLNFSLKVNKDMEANVRAYVEGYISGQKTTRSYYLNISTRKIVSVVSSSCLYELESALTSSSVNSLSPDPGYITVQGSLRYINESGGFSPTRHVKVNLYDDDLGLYPEGDILLAETYTDENGYFTFPPVENEDGPLQDGLDIYVHVLSKSDWDAVEVRPGGIISTVPYRWVTEKRTNVPDGIHDFGELYPTEDSEALQALDAALTEYQWIQENVGWTRNQILIKWPEGTWPSHIYTYHSVTGEIVDDWIELPDKTTWNWTHDTVHHEYGHAVMAAAYGWNHFNMPLGWGPDPHYVFSESSQGFAVLEGWAEFMQCVVDNNASNVADWSSGHGGDIETNDWYDCIDTGDMDGDIIEGSVASILWDIWDSPTTDDDGLGLGFDEIWNIMLNYRPKNIHEFWDSFLAVYGGHKQQLWGIYYNYGIYKARGHDLIVTNVTPWKTVVGQGLTLKMNVTVLNWGDFTENFNITAYANTTIIDTLTNITLTSRNSTTVTFNWNTTDVAYGNYTLSATATTVPDETDTIDNSHIDGTVFVTITGDANGDGKVDAFDLFDLSKVYGSGLSKPDWNPNYDFNDDSKVDASDLFDLSKNYGVTNPYPESHLVNAHHTQAFIFTLSAAVMIAPKFRENKKRSRAGYATHKNLSEILNNSYVIVIQGDSHE